MRTQSLWEQTLTFFPQFQAALAEQNSHGTVAVVGASDGKFVIPLAAAGNHVIAVERDSVALHGGQARLPGVERVTVVPGLVDRLKREELHDRVQIIEGDFLQITEVPDMICDAVWTSCSWHYSANHNRPLADFVERMKRLVRPGGLFGAEFMMPVEPHHRFAEHYTSPERLRQHFIGDWEVLLTLRTNEFTERAHVGQPHDHTHRMGLLLASRAPDALGQ
jgi:SAM-dependent methyltransferase